MEDKENKAGVYYSTVDKEIAKEVLRLGEIKIQAQLQIGLASNQRAATLCGIFATATIATLGAAMVANERAIGGSFAGVGVFCAIMLMAASFCCLKAMWPVGFWTVGNDPKSWLSREMLTGSFADSLLHEAENYQDYIEDNSKTNAKCATWLKRGAILGCTAPVVALIAWLAFYFWG